MKKPRKPELFQTEKLEKIKDFLAVIQQGERQDIMTTLIEKGTLTASEVHCSLRIEQSTCSIHLKKLKEYGLVIARNEGKVVYYSVNEENLNKAKKLIKQLYDNLPE